MQLEMYKIVSYSQDFNAMKNLAVVTKPGAD